MSRRVSLLHCFRFFRHQEIRLSCQLSPQGTLWGMCGPQHKGPKRPPRHGQLRLCLSFHTNMLYQLFPNCFVCSTLFSSFIFIDAYGQSSFKLSQSLPFLRYVAIFNINPFPYCWTPIFYMAINKHSCLRLLNTCKDFSVADIQKSDFRTVIKYAYLRLCQILPQCSPKQVYKFILPPELLVPTSSLVTPTWHYHALLCLPI